MRQKKETTSLTLDPEAKRAGVAVLDKMGISLSSFVEMSLRQVAVDGALPFRPSTRVSSNAPLLLSGDETLRRLNDLAAAVPQQVRKTMASLTPNDERQMLRDRYE